MEYIDHNSLQFGIYFFERPGKPFGVLTHLQCGSCNTACIGSLSGTEQNTVLLEILGSIHCSRHIRAFRYREASVCNERFRVFQIQLILCRTRKGDIAFHSPYAFAFMIFRARSCRRVFRQTGTFYFFYLFQKRNIDAFRIINPTGGIGTGNRFSA